LELVDLSGADLSNADLRMAKLTNDVVNADAYRTSWLPRAKLAKADLRGNREGFWGPSVTDLTATNLEGTILSGVKYNQETEWLRGSIHPGLEQFMRTEQS
jgi:uncharacterized protein YjbI with pentapeptide repeats